MRTNASRHIFALAAALCLAGLSPIAALAQGQPPQSSNAAQVPASVPAPTPPLAAGQSKVIPTSFDLRKAVEYGLANNPTMVSARAQLLGSEYAQNAAMADFLPTATASYGVTSYDRQPKNGGVNTGDQTLWSSQLNLHQPVFTGFRLLSTFQKAKLTKEQNEAKLTQTELSLISSIQTYYLSHLKAKMDVKSAEDSVERLQSQLKVTQAFYEVGLKPKLDVLQAQVDLATSQQTLLIARNSLDTTRAKLNSLLNLPLEAPVEYVGELAFSPFSLNLNDCLTQAYKNRPDILIGVKSVAMACGVLAWQGRIFIQKRRKDDVWPGLWEFPGGVMEEGERPEETLVREYMPCVLAASPASSCSRSITCCPAGPAWRRWSRAA